ncbi:MAG: PolC-type DNA polymerase III [Lachnospiraceae bacterium]|nr:PolC-type DNA polymerase III [Lachnospiraceae bacterium]
MTYQKKPDPKPFFEAFPSLKLDQKTHDLMQYVIVERVTFSKAGNCLKIYLTSENWLKKQLIQKLEDAIGERVFGNAGQYEIKVIERFRLSSSYTLFNFYKVYRTSMLYELKQVDPLLYQTFLHTELKIEDDRILAVIPDNPVYLLKKDALIAYVEKVFCERAGFQAAYAEYEVTAGKTEEKEAAPADLSIENRVKQVVRDNENRKKPQEEEKKLPEKEEKRFRPKKAQFVRSEKDPSLIYGRSFDAEPEPLDSLGNDQRDVTIRGEVFASANKTLKSGRVLFTASLTDYTDSIRIKLWLEPSDLPEYEAAFKNGSCFAVHGLLDFDPYDRELMISRVFGIRRIGSIKEKREDHEPVKRVELHCHTQMSDMDAVSSATDIIKQAYRFGMNAIAITDHGVVQAFPEAAHKKGLPKDADMKIIYGMEAYLVDDMKNLVGGSLTGEIAEPCVVFQLVTTGQSPYSHDIIEIGAQKVENGQLTDEFHTLINPGRPIPFAIRTEVGISDDMVQNAPDLQEALKDFLAFAGDLPLVAYEAEQELNFIFAACERYGFPHPSQTYLDLASAARYLMPDLGKIRFRTLIRQLKVPCSDELRAYGRARSMAFVCVRLQDLMKKQGIETYAQLNEQGTASVDRIRNLRYYHAIILAKNEIGRRNLYTLVSESHLRYYKSRPRIPRSLLNAHRDGLILGSACSAGELYDAILNGASDAEIARIVNYYDYLEIQPDGNNMYLLKDPRSGIHSVEDLQDINRRIVKLGEQFRKPVCATCDVHFLNPEDAIYRSIIQAGHGFKDEGGQPPLYLRTTEEMLAEFSYLGDQKCREVVIDNTNLIASMIGNVSPIYPHKCPPSIPHSEEDLEAMCYETARDWYGDPLPAPVQQRLEKELTSIIKNGYAVMYIIAQKLVQKSNEDGYLVGSRGSVGSSFAATMSHITEVNPLAPHYRCPHCKYSEFDSEETRLAHEEGRSGCDMPDKNCPVCGTPLTKDGFDIPFETFLGFKGDKEPDIDLNFSGDEQGIAQQFVEVIFGRGQTFKAGTIGTVADKTAYGYALHYFEDKGETRKNCELERLSKGCTGVRRTTGQHPGGVIVLPKGMDINWFTPIQHPANDINSPFITTHFDYHSIDTNLLKLDILGHDDPTIIRMLQDLTDTDPHLVPLDDKDVLSLFRGTEALGVTKDQLDGCEFGTLGIPEFGTNFVMGMLRDTLPKTFSELIRISGLSHGTDVWLDNAQYYIQQGDCTLGTAICTRDDIMLNLIIWGVEPEHSFKIMEAVRKGKGLTPEQEQEMREHGVPDWYIASCKKIKYMFPKAHAAAYVMNAFRIAYYKIHYPLAYYAAFFSIRAKTFNYEKMCQGPETLEYYADLIRNNPNPTAKDKDEFDDMKLVREMYARGFSFHRLDIYKAKATRCQIIDGKIMPALNSVGGMGDTQAMAVEREAARAPFLSKDDFRTRTKVSKTIIDLLEEQGVLKDIPESNQISLFDLFDT